MQKGFLLGLFAYASFSWGDATIKSLGSQVSVFEIGFFSILFSGIFIFFSKPREERWREFWRMSRPFAVHGRAISGLFAGILGIYAFTTIPLAEAYALIFLSPLFVTVLGRCPQGRYRAVALGGGSGRHRRRHSCRAARLQDAGTRAFRRDRRCISGGHDHRFAALAGG
nr:hypothetical protein [Rhizobium sp. X9]